MKRNHQNNPHHLDFVCLQEQKVLAFDLVVQKNQGYHLPIVH